MPFNETVEAGPTGETEEVAQPSGSIFDDPELEEQSSVESGEGEEVAQGEADVTSETENEDADWLPEEQLKVFRPEDVARYAKRYGYTQEEIEADPRLARFLHDKINTDIEIANRRKAEEEAEQAEEEETTEEAEPTRELDPAQAQAHIETELNRVVDQITDPKVAVAFTKRLAEADAIKDPEQRAVAVTKALTFGMSNALRDLLPAYLGGENGWLQRQIESYIEAKMPGLGESHTQASLAQTVDALRSNPEYTSMPKFGTPEWDAAAQKAAEMMPGMENVKFHDPKTGRELPRMEQFKRKAEIMFRLLTKQPGAVAQATKAIETGKQVERANQQRKTLGKLGAGQSKGLAPKSTGNDDIFGSPGEIQVTQRLVGKAQS